MTKTKSKISIAINKDIDKKLEENSYNKSKLINSLLKNWLKSDKKDLNYFKKKCD